MGDTTVTEGTCGAGVNNGAWERTTGLIKEYHAEEEERQSVNLGDQVLARTSRTVYHLVSGDRCRISCLEVLLISLLKLAVYKHRSRATCRQARSKGLANSRIPVYYFEVQAVSLQKARAKADDWW